MEVWIYTKNAPQRTERHFVAVRMGLEPTTSGVTGPHSNQLNYRTRRSLCLMFFSNADAKIGIFSELASVFEKKLKKSAF